MGHLSGVTMATDPLSGTIVKLSNEKIRKYHLASPSSHPTFPAPIPSFSHPPVGPTTFLFLRVRDAGWKSRETAFRRLAEAVAGDA